MKQEQVFINTYKKNQKNDRKLKNLIKLLANSLGLG